MNDLNVKHICAMCKSKFTQKKNLYAHVRKIHQIEPRNSIPKKKFQCNLCDKKFSHQHSLTRHTRQNHSAIIEHGPVRKVRLICPHDKCNDAFLSYVDLRGHLLEQHDIKVKCEELTFNSTSDFGQWRVQIQDKTQSLYTQDSAMRILKNGVRRIFFNCHRSYHYKSKSKSSHAIKVGTYKIGKACPSRLEMTLTGDKEDSNVSVKFWKTHCGHHTEQNTKINQNKNIGVKETGKLHDSTDKELDSDCDSGSNNNTSESLLRLDHTDKHNIDKDFDNEGSKYNQKDAVSISQWIEETDKLDEDSIILYYKESTDKEQDLLFLNLANKMFSC